ncbi:TPA: hypothetical protein DDW35_12270, partial [Candidatus Sumerlaeota bacterium]|nr:hypothetical protein [Candidatus Sumerlaeota bacterium]
MKLKSLLRNLPLADLEAIQAFWQFPPLPTKDRTPTVDDWVEHLYHRLQNPASFQGAFNRLTDFQRELCQTLAIHGGSLDVSEIRRRSFPKTKKNSVEDTNPRVLKDELAEMARRGFIFEDKWTDYPEASSRGLRIYGLPECFLRCIELPHFWKYYLGNLLHDYSAEQLGKIVAQVLKGIPLATKREQLMYQIRETLTDPVKLRTCVDMLPGDQREILFLLLQRRGVCQYRELVSLLQTRRSEIAPTDAVENLLASSGMLFLETHNSVRHENLLRIPRDLYYIISNHFVADNRCLRDLDALSRTQDFQPRAILDNGISILRDLVIFVSYAARHGVRRLTGGGIGKNDLKKALARLSANKTLKYAQFLAYFAIWKKFLVPAGDSFAVSAEFEHRLLDSRALYLDILTSWFECSEWNEEYIDGDCLHADVRPSNLIAIHETRRLVLENLGKIPFDSWIEGPRFIESLLVQMEMRIPRRGARERLEKQNRINYLVVESVLCETLHWLGIVAVGLHEKTDMMLLGNRSFEESAVAGNGTNNNDRVDHHFNFNPRPLLPDACKFHFQITGLGRSLLVALQEHHGIFASDAPVALPFRDDMIHFTILPNLDVVAPPDLNLARFHKLRRFAIIRHIDVMSILGITRDSLRSGLDAGLTGEEILTFLQESCPSGIPDTVRHLIRECTARYGEVTLAHAGGYIRTEDPTLLENLKNNKTFASFIKEVVGGNTAILQHNADLQHVARELQKMGLLPVRDSENVHATSDGRIQFSLKREDFGLLLALLETLLSLEKTLGAPITEDMALPLMHVLRPAQQAHLNVGNLISVLSKRFEKNLEAALEKKVNTAAGKYRKQMRDLMAQRSTNSRRHSAYADANPATDEQDIRKLLHFAIEQETEVELRYMNSSQEEIVERVRPESLNGEKIHAFSEEA